MFIDLTGTFLAHFCQIIIELDGNNIAQPEFEEKEKMTEYSKDQSFGITIKEQ